MQGRTWSPEQRLQMSVSRKGKKLSEEHKDKIGRGVKGKTLGLWKGKPRSKPLTPEQVVAYRERMIGNQYNVGRLPPTPETRAKLSAAAKGNTSKSGMIDSLETRDRKSDAQLRRPAWGSSGLKGVCKHIQNGVWNGKWQSRLKVKDRRYYLGLFNCPAAAHFAYLVAVDRYV